MNSASRCHVRLTLEIETFDNNLNIKRMSSSVCSRQNQWRRRFILLSNETIRYYYLHLKVINRRRRRSGFFLLDYSTSSWNQVSIMQWSRKADDVWFQTLIQLLIKKRKNCKTRVYTVVFNVISIFFQNCGRKFKAIFSLNVCWHFNERNQEVNIKSD